MLRSSKKRKPIPRHFQNVAEAADFWDSHDLTDYWDLTQEASFEADIWLVCKTRQSLSTYSCYTSPKEEYDGNE